MRAGGVAYWESEDGNSRYVTVEASRAGDRPERFDDDNRCRLLFATTSDDFGLQVSVDGGLPMTLPPHSGSFPPSLLALALDPGHHELRVTSGRWARSFEAEKQISCMQGESSYVRVALSQGRHTTGWNLTQEYSIELTVTAQDPDPLRKRGLIIYANGQWLVPQEPRP